MFASLTRNNKGVTRVTMTITRTMRVSLGRGTKTSFCPYAYRMCKGMLERPLYWRTRNVCLQRIRQYAYDTGHYAY